MLDAELKKAATRWATQITNESKKNLGKFGRLIGIQSKSETKNGVVSIVTTAINKTKNRWGVVRVARAYEKGSGIHGSRRSKYPITPRSKGLLVFYWQKLDMHVALPRVSHPGVEAANNGKGYMKPAIDKVRRQVRKETPEIVRKEVRLTIRRAFTNVKQR